MLPKIMNILLLFSVGFMQARKLVPPITCTALNRLTNLQTDFIPTTTLSPVVTKSSVASSLTSSVKASVTAFPLCEKLVVSPAYDPKGNAYGTENEKSCLVRPGCRTCVTNNTGEPFPAAAQLNFITRKDNKLYDGNTPFRFISFNVPSMLMLEDRPSTHFTFIPPDVWEQIDAAATVAGFEGRVARTYTLGFGPGQHVTAPRTYNAQALLAMDNAIAAAKRYNIRLIIPLINNHKGSGSGYYYGDYGQFTALRNKKASDFFKDRVLIDDFKHLITTLLNRVNTVTKIAYKNEPVIFAWQLGNELGSWTDSPPPSAWIIEIAKHIKSIATKTLVMDGVIGGWKRYQQAVLNSGLIDIFTNHYYGDFSSMKADSSFVASCKKVFVACEFGFGNSITFYDNAMDLVIKNQNITGLLIWSLRYHSIEGGFYVHYEGIKDFVAYHAPGFAAKPGFGVEEEALMPLVRYYAYKIQGLDPRKGFPIPWAPSRATGITSPKSLKWRGSAWAKGYNIERRLTDSTTWTRVASNVPDNVAGPAPIYNDVSATKGKDYIYRIQACGVGGAVSDWLSLGPMRA